MRRVPHTVQLLPNVLFVQGVLGIYMVNIFQLYHMQGGIMLIYWFKRYCYSLSVTFKQTYNDLKISDNN